MSDLVQLHVEEAVTDKFIIHLRAQLLDALRVPIRQICRVLALEKFDHLL